MSIGNIKITLSRALYTVLSDYIDLFAAITRIIGSVGVSVPQIVVERTPVSIDQRLAKLEIAKSALAESLSAIEELQREAESGKKEHARISAELAATIANKDDAERKLDSIKKLIDQDVEAFQTLAGVTNVRRERVIGFGSGIATSVIATVIWTLGSYLIRKFGLVS